MEGDVSTPPRESGSNIRGATITTRWTTAAAVASPKEKKEKTPSSMQHLQFHLQIEGMRVFNCAYCCTLLASYDDIVSKNFHGRTGRAFLLHNMVNICMGEVEEKQLRTGKHAVADVFCRQCGHELGWTYVKAHESLQQYKEGKFIVEKAKIVLTRDAMDPYLDYDRSS